MGKVEMRPSIKGDTLRWDWRDGRRPGGLYAHCIVIASDGRVFNFTGQDIPGVVHVTDRDGEKRGKWTSTTFWCASPLGTVVVAWVGEKTVEELLRELSRFAPHADRETIWFRQAISAGHSEDTLE